MAFEPFVWYCRPVAGGVWTKAVENALGAYTPCAIDSVVIVISHLVVLGLCIYRTWLIKNNFKAQRFCLKSKIYNYMLCLLAAYCVFEPLFRLIRGISVLNLDGQDALAPFEVVALIIQALAWCSMLVMLLVETKVYVFEFRWIIRFGVVYILVADAVMLNLILSVKDFYERYVLYWYISEVFVQALFGVLLVAYVPNLDPYPGHTPLNSESVDVEYEELPEGEHICPERRANLFSKTTFAWMNSILKLGYERPLTEKDVWKLDLWDRTETLYDNFQKVWAKESQKSKPWLLRGLNNSIGGRFWLGGIWKIGNDLSQFVGPVILNKLLESMQRGDPSQIGYIYAFSIFAGVILGVLCEAQYFQNVMRVGYRLRSTLVAAVFRKSLRLTHEARKTFATGKITNLMTTDAETLQQITQSLHSLWSAPFRITIAMVLLYQQLGVSALFGSSLLVLLFPIQTLVISRLQKQSKEGLQRTDKRIGLMNEILAAMDTVKCYAWESSFQSKIQSIRDDELSWFRKASLLGALNGFILNSIPVLVTVAAFGLFTVLGGDLTPSRAFTSLSLFAVLRFPLFLLPNIITQVVNAKVSLKRMEELLLAEEKTLLPNPPLDPQLPAISIKNGYFSWDSKAEKPTLSNINLDVPVGSLVAIVGSTGEGKTSLISAMLGELPAIAADTNVIIRGTVAYVPQVAWIFNATVRDNILFGSTFESARYEKAIDITALQHDLDLLPGGDLTEIGERGVNISGGQKQRVSLARAVYSNSDVYIFDDPLSALDAHVAREVFEKCIRGELRGKTRVLVTNQLHLLSQVDRIILVHEGVVKEEGTYEELYENGKLFQRLMESAGKLEENTEENEDGETSDTKKSTELAANGMGNDHAKDAGSSKKRKEHKSVLIKQEERETGVVSWKVLSRYKDALGGLWVVLILLLSYVLSETLRVFSSLWLSSWTDQSNLVPSETLFYNTIYAGLSLAQVFVTLVNSYWLIVSSLYAAKRLHDQMLSSILRAPMVFFNTNPLGRIINRFAKDLGDIDRNVAPFVNMFIGQISQLLSTFVLIGVVSTLSLWAILPLLLLFYAAYLYYQSMAREIKRLDSISRSPVYAQFGEALNGLSTIRAYKAYDRMADINGKAMDNNIRFTLVNMSGNRWLSIRLEAVGGLMIWFTATFAVMQNGRAENQKAFASTMGLLLSYALNITSLLTAVLRLASMAENSLNSVERVGTYIDLPSEAPPIIESNRPPPGWPSSGLLKFEDVVLRYRPELPPVLHGLSFTVFPSDKVGIVGRTGAGKSSMLNALFRIVELEAGERNKIPAILSHSLSLSLAACLFPTSRVRVSPTPTRSPNSLPILHLTNSFIPLFFQTMQPAPGVAPHNMPHQAPQYQQQQPPYMMMPPQPPQPQPVPQMWPQQPQAVSPQGQPPQPASADEVRTLWIGDLQYWMDENYLFNCFAHTGEISSVKVIRNKQTGQSEGYGFLEFLTRPAAERVLQTYNGTPMPNGAQNFRLNWASAGEKRQDDSPDYTIFVGDLAGDVTDYVLQETFRARYTSVKGAKVVIDRLTGRTKGYGFVKFGDETEQMRAMTEMNGVLCSSRPMRIGPAANKNTSGSQQYAKTSYQNTPGTQNENDPNNTTIFVGNLDSNVTDEHLRQVFSQYGELVHVKIPAGKRCGFVQFSDRSCAEEALRILNGTQIGGQNIRLSWGRSPSNKQPQADPNQWNGGGGGGYYGYGQGYENYSYTPAAQDPNMFYSGYAGYGNYQQPAPQQPSQQQGGYM